jgi:hypothetical protein
MLVTWIGSDSVRAYFDPARDVVDCLTDRPSEGGTSWTLDGALALAGDGDDIFCHIVLERAGLAQAAGVPERPAECPILERADLELDPSAAPRYHFDSTQGALRIAFEGVEARQWGRLGSNLAWLAIDDDGRLAAIVVEGVSRDSGGRGQLAWLAEVWGNGGS